MNIIEPRFSIIDTMLICVVGLLIAQSMFLAATCAAVIGMGITGFIGAVFGKRAKDKQWQLLMRQDRKIEAIKMHRFLYNTTLKDAKEVVDAYQATLQR